MRFSYLELFSDFLDDFFALLFFLMKTLLLSFKELLVPSLRIFEIFRCIDGIEDSLGLIASQRFSNAHERRLLARINKKKRGQQVHSYNTTNAKSVEKLVLKVFRVLSFSILNENFSINT